MCRLPKYVLEFMFKSLFRVAISRASCGSQKNEKTGSALLSQQGLTGHDAKMINCLDNCNDILARPRPEQVTSHANMRDVWIIAQIKMLRE